MNSTFVRALRPAIVPALLVFAVAFLFIAFSPKAADAVSPVTTVFLTSGTSWTVPADWNSSNNTIEVIGGGGGGGGAGNDSNDAGAGGGGGAYAKISNLSLTPGGSVTYQVGSGGSGDTSHGTGGNGQDTFFNRTDGHASSCDSGNMSVCADGGDGGHGNGGDGGHGGSSSSGQSIGTVKYSGGDGADSSSNGTGGGGAAGPHGAGGDASGTMGGRGDNSNGGTGGTSGNAGNPGQEFDATHGSGGGGGGNSSHGNGGVGGNYGAGGGGGDESDHDGAAGSQGLIVITYIPVPTTGSLNVIKNTLGGDGTFNFTGDAGDFSVITSGGTGSSTLGALTPGSYSVTETPQSGWDQTGNTCSEVSVTAGNTATCTVTNAKHGAIEITKYSCPADTTVTRANNGVDGTPPDGCVPQTGATFGYVHGSQTDANSPFPELGGPFVAGGATDGSGVLTISDLTSAGRYLVAETDGSGNQLAANAILGLYCTGDGDTSGTNDNQELTFVPAGGTTQCVAYDPAPAPTTLHVTILKYIDGQIATSGSALALSFPMHSSWSDDINSGSGNFALGTTGFSTTTPYVAITRTMDVPADYATNEVIDGNTVYAADSDFCPAGKFRFVGYRTGNTLSAAEAAADTTDAPSFTGLTGDKYVIVDNTPCQPPCNTDASQTIVSDASTQYNGGNSTLIDSSMVKGGVLPPTGVWVGIPGASWIWGSNGSADNTTVSYTEDFTRSFTIVGTATSASIGLSADNGYVLIVNGTTVDTKNSNPADEHNYSSVHTYDISSYVHTGTNTLEVDVTNFPISGSTFHNNPAGLIYKLTVNNNECVAPQVKVHIQKYLKDGDTITAVADNAGIAPFPMTSTWQAANLNGGAQASGSYTLGTNYGGSASTYGADTAAMDAPVALYSTEEVTGGDSQVLPAGAQCVPGKYRLVGYQSGDSPEAAAAASISTTAPSLTNFGQDEYINVINEDCAGVITTVTMCKIDTHENPLAGWTLTLTGAHVEDVTVPAGSITGTTTDPLLAGVSYIATAMGTWLNNRTPLNTVDAEYSTEDNWATHMDGFTGFGPDILDLQANGNFVNWGAYNSNHTYATSFVPAADGPATFNIFDGTGGVPNPSWYSDNTGSLDVSLSQGYAGITGDNGCVSFDNVPFGDYTVGETPQDGWSNVSGLGDVTVSAENNNFTVVNQQIDTGEGTGTLTLIKNTTGGQDGTFNFQITGATATSTGITTIDGSGTQDITLNAGSSTVSELEQANWNLSSTSCVYDNESAGIAVAGGEEVHIDSGDHVTCTFTNDFTGEGGGPTATSQTIVVHDHDLSTTTSGAVSSPGTWAFWNDTTNIVDDSLGGMITGPGTPPAGLGSAQMSALAGARPLLGTLGLIGTPLNQVTSLTYSTYRSQGDPTLALALQFDINPDITVATSSYDGRLVYEPYFTQTVQDNTWQSWNTLATGANWWFSNAWLATESGCSQATPCTMSQVLAAFPNIGISGITAFKAGSWSSDFTGNVDKFVITLDDGSNATTTTVDFDPMADTQTVITNATDLTNNSSTVGNPYTVEWSVTSSGPGTPTGTVTVTANGGAGCSADVSAGQCDITPGSAGTYSLVATYGGDGSGFAPSVSDSVSHTVVPPVTFSSLLSTNSGGSNGPPAGGGAGGFVLGTSTESGTGEGSQTCSTPLITQIPMGQHYKNDPNQVKLLQNFLNGEMNAGLPVSGVFGSLTTAAVKAFQLKYWQDILAPWVPHGLPSDHTPTGIVYKTTARMINNLYCAALNLPIPNLP